MQLRLIVLTVPGSSPLASGPMCQSKGEGVRRGRVDGFFKDVGEVAQKKKLFIQGVVHALQDRVLIINSVLNHSDQPFKFGS